MTNRCAHFGPDIAETSSVIKASASPSRRFSCSQSVTSFSDSRRGYLVRPVTATRLPAVLVIHENRGLNPYIEDVARRLAVANFIAFAPDALTSVGGYSGDDEKGLALFA